MEQVKEYNHFNNGYSKASKALGIAAILSTFLVPVYLPFILGGLAIILAIISRGKYEIDSDGWIGITTGIVAIAVNIAMVFLAVYIFIKSQYVRDIINAQYMKMYGITFNSMIEKIIGNGFDLDMYLFRQH